MIPQRINLEQWDRHYAELVASGLREPAYGGPLRRHVNDGDYRLLKLTFDNSSAALRLWNFLLTEEQRLREARAQGKTIIGTMKDLGTIPVMAYAMPQTVAFYPDGAWWVPCIMQLSTRDLSIADSMGIDSSFCPVRAMLGAFATGEHFPKPDLLICSVGATCDDFSAIAQRLQAMGHTITWWEIPHRRKPDAGEEAVKLPGGFDAPRSLVQFVMGQLQRLRAILQQTTGYPLTDKMLAEGIRAANRVRSVLQELRQLVFAAPAAPLPGLEMLIAEMLAIHYCSDRDETIAVLEDLKNEVAGRVKRSEWILPPDAARIFWVNPVADLRVMNLLEECGGRLCGTDFMFCHALDEIPENLPPMQALAQMALADPMVGPAADRARRIIRDLQQWKAEAVVVSRIPGASHCGLEGSAIHAMIGRELGLPVVEIEVPPVCDSFIPTLRTRLEALVEVVRQRRGR